jgi:hypothetical protein
MHKKLLSMVALTILLASSLVACSEAPSDSSTLTILSITEGDVFVMKAGTDDWTDASVEMTLGIGDAVKTGDDSGAEITFFDGSTIELEAGTQIEITSLHTSPDTGTKTITLMQTIGTTVSRVTALLDPASTYAVQTPSGVAAVRGTIMVVRIVFDDPNYEDGTVLITCEEGEIWIIWNGLELRIPEGYTCIITPDGLLELIPPNEPPQDEGPGDTDEDTANGQSDDQQPDSSTTGSWPPPPMTPPPVVVYSDPPVVQTPVTPPNGDETPPNGDETPPNGDETPPNGETTDTIEIRITSNPKGGAIYIYDATANGGQGAYVVEGTVETVPGGQSFELAGDHHYYIWLEGEDTTYDPKQYPDDWTEESPDVAPDARAVYGCAEDAKETGNNPFHFGQLKQD